MASRFLWRWKKYNNPASSAKTAIAIPTPIPAFAPVDRPSASFGVVLDVVVLVIDVGDAVLDVSVNVALALLVADASNFASRSALAGVNLLRSDSAQAMDTAHWSPKKSEVTTMMVVSERAVVVSEMEVWQTFIPPAQSVGEIVRPLCGIILN